MTTNTDAVPSEAKCDFVAVPRASVEWLKQHYPALTEKAGMCERIGGRLYTKSASEVQAEAVRVTEADVIQTCEVHGFPLDPGQMEVVTAVVNQILLSASKPTVAQMLPQPVLDALRFYANGHHFNIDDDHQQFDTVSGEPQNWLMSEQEDDCTMIEDGSIAKAVLLGGLPGFEEPTEPLDGEVFAAYPAAPAQSSDDTRAAVDFYAANPSAALMDFQKRFSAAPAQSGEPVAIPGECAASGASCSYAPEGRHGEMQCRYCGRPKQSAVVLDDEQIDATWAAIDFRSSTFRGPHLWEAELRRRFARAILATQAIAGEGRERAALQSIIDAGRNSKPLYEGGIGENTVYLTSDMYAALGQPPISAFEGALAELVNKIDTGLDTGDLLKDAKRASAALDSILSGGDLVACAHEYFRDSGDRYEKSIEFRIGWNACLDAIANARAASPQAMAPGLTRDAIQQKAVDHGFRYWRAPDSHGVTGTEAQAVELLQDLLGVEVEIAAQTERALTDAEIENGWHKTFSASNPFCPCDLKSFAKAVRWAEYAVAKEKK